MAKKSKDELTDGQKQNLENTNPESESGPIEPKKTGSAKGCDHDYVFHMSQKFQDRPGKIFEYRRCAKCNDIQLTVKDV